MQPSRHTPTQSMLRLPAASAAVIACAASATSDSPYRTMLLGGSPTWRPRRTDFRTPSLPWHVFLTRAGIHFAIIRGFRPEQVEKQHRPASIPERGACRNRPGSRKRPGFPETLGFPGTSPGADGWYGTTEE